MRFAGPYYGEEGAQCDVTGARLVISDDHLGLKQSIAAVLPGAGWQRCRVHFVRNLLTRVPKSARHWSPLWSA